MAVPITKMINQDVILISGRWQDLIFRRNRSKKLIEEGITDTIRGFKSKSGKRFDACLKLNKDEQTNKVSATFDFENVKPQKVEGIVCPDCGGDIYVSPYGYRCANYNRQTEDGCHFFVGRIADKQLSQVQFFRAHGKRQNRDDKGL